MLKTIKTFTRNLIIGANVATVIMMLLVGYSGRLNPESFPILSNACLTFPIFLVINVFFLFFWLLFYPKGTLVSLLGIIISYVPVRTYCPLNLKSEKPVGCIKVMTYNVDGSMKKETDAQGRVTYPALESIGAYWSPLWHHDAASSAALRPQTHHPCRWCHRYDWRPFRKITGAKPAQR